jgi:hypothetical protein
MTPYEFTELHPQYNPAIAEAPAGPETIISQVYIGRMALPAERTAIDYSLNDNQKSAEASPGATAREITGDTPEPATENGGEPPLEPPRSGQERSGEAPEPFGPRKFDGKEAQTPQERETASDTVRNTFGIAQSYTANRFTDEGPDGRKSIEIDLVANGGLYRMNATDDGDVKLHTYRDGTVENYDYRIVVDPENPQQFAAWRQQKDPAALEQLVRDELADTTSPEPLELRLSQLPRKLYVQQELNRSAGVGGQYVSPEEAMMLKHIAETGQPKIVDAKDIVAEVAYREAQLHEGIHEAPAPAANVEARDKALQIIRDHYQDAPESHKRASDHLHFTAHATEHHDDARGTHWNMNVIAGWADNGREADSPEAHPFVKATIQGPATYEQLASHDAAHADHAAPTVHNNFGYTAETILTYSADPATRGLQVTTKTTIRDGLNNTIGQSVIHTIPAGQADVRKMRNFIENPAIVPPTEADYS